MAFSWGSAAISAIHLGIAVETWSRTCKPKKNGNTDLHRRAPEARERKIVPKGSENRDGDDQTAPRAGERRRSRPSSSDGYECMPVRRSTRGMLEMGKRPAKAWHAV